MFIFLGRVDKVPDPEPHGGYIVEDEVADGGLVKDLNEVENNLYESAIQYG